MDVGCRPTISEPTISDMQKEISDAHKIDFFFIIMSLAGSSTYKSLAVAE